MTSLEDFKLDPPANKVVEAYRRYQYLMSQGRIPSMMQEPHEVRSTIHQSIEITNGNFTFRISSDGKFIKIERIGGNMSAPGRDGFFLIPVDMWDEVVNFVFQETARRKAELDISE
jgi:hypothetical protein